MTRAALLPAGSDPFLLAYWLRNFATWSQYVDELHVAVCGPLEPEPLAYIESLIASTPGATLYHLDKRTDHGTVIGLLVDKTSADTVMLCEDDAFVRRPEVIDQCFRVAEAGGIAATPRGGYAAHEVVAASVQKFGDYHAYWPCFVFVSRAALMATDHDFGGTIWSPGQKLFDYTFREMGGSDTLVSASLQLRAMGLPETLIDNHRLSGQTVPDDAPWVHVGSLSGGHGNMFMADIPEDRYRFELDMFGRLPPGNALQRVAWWQRAWRAADGAIPEYHARYWAGLEKFRADIGISQPAIDAYWFENLPIVTWAER